MEYALGVKACCVIGRKDFGADQQSAVRQALLEEIEQAIRDGYNYFISGFAEGVDLIFASLVASLMEKNPALSLEAALPYRERLQATDQLFQRLLSQCKVIVVCSEEYGPDCFLKRNRFMVDSAQRIIAVCGAHENGPICSTLEYAQLREKDVRYIEI